MFFIESAHWTIALIGVGTLLVTMETCTKGSQISDFNSLRPNLNKTFENTVYLAMKKMFYTDNIVLQKLLSVPLMQLGCKEWLKELS